MRIGLDFRPAASVPFTGIGRQNLALANALKSLNGVQLCLFSPAPTDHPLRNTINCPNWSSPMQGMHKPQIRLRFEALYLPRALRDLAIDVHINNFNMGLPLPPRPAGIRYVLQLHDLFQLTLNNKHDSSLKALAYRITDFFSIVYSIWVADQIWTPSQFTADEVAKKFPFAKNKLRVLPNMVSGFTEAPAAMGQYALPARYWLAVGTREPRKNMPWFISAWQEARDRNPHIPELVLVGDRDDLPVELRNLPGLHVLSCLSDAELHALYLGAERLWQPAYAEGFGLPVIEALSVGTPVAVATGSALDEITPGDTPRFDPYDRQALILLMENMAKMPPVQPDDLKQWAARFSEEPYKLRLAELLQELQA